MRRLKSLAAVEVPPVRLHFRWTRRRSLIETKLTGAMSIRLLLETHQAVSPGREIPRWPTLTLVSSSREVSDGLRFHVCAVASFRQGCVLASAGGRIEGSTVARNPLEAAASRQRIRRVAGGLFI